ncbi:MAG: hypothetical protein ABIG90_00985 [bacterium]
MKSKIIITSIICAYFLLLPAANAMARQGCCSHHNGVCGCRCCDGTALSATCAPYYPSCQTLPKIEPKVEVKEPAPKEHENNAYEFYQVPNEPVIGDENAPVAAQASPEATSHNWTWLFWLGGIAILGFIIYAWRTYDKKQ